MVQNIERYWYEYNTTLYVTDLIVKQILFIDSNRNLTEHSEK